MKVFISDIHLTDETTGKHNILPKDVDFFWNDIQVNGIEKKDIELIILGDFFDCIRSLKWTGNTQPWGNDANADKATVQIVKGIITKNKKALDKLKNFFQGRISYVMGNHDRLIWQVGAAKKLVTKALGISDDRMRVDYLDEQLGIYATHGNHRDEYNSFDLGKRETPIGDAIVTLLINKFPEEVGKELKKPKLKKALQEIDNLRPSLLAPVWIDYNTRNLPEDERQKVKDIWQELADKFYEKPFVADWFDKYDVWYNPVDKADKLQFAFEYFTETSMKRMLERFQEIKDDFYKPKSEYIEGAVDALKDEKYKYVLYGHTHEPVSHLLGEQSGSGKGKFYMNTGTWRRRIIIGEPKRRPLFSLLKTISYVVFYNEKEKKTTKRDFELWNGTIA